MRRALIAEQLESALRQSLDAPRLRLLQLEGDRPAVDEASQPWIGVKYGRVSAGDWFGVVPAVAHFERIPGAVAESLPMAVKINPRTGMSRGLLPWIVEKAGIRLDRPIWDYRAMAEFDDTAGREPHVYRALAPKVPALAAVLPRCYGEANDAETGERALFFEFVMNVKYLDPVGELPSFPSEAIDEIFGAVARWQAAFWKADEELGWAGPRLRTTDMVDDRGLWQGILDDARVRFPAIVTDKVHKRRSALIERLPDWYAAKDAQPSTLSHNDFNHRNVGLRPAVLVLDWEVAECNTAHRDLVEFLTFALAPTVERAEVDRIVEVHRMALVNAGVAGIDRDSWLEGFRAELKVEAINRVGFQLLVAATFPIDYLARINLVNERLLDFYG